MKKYIVVTTAYPSEKNKYANGFIHTRVKEYIKDKIEIVIWVNKDVDKVEQYIYEGVTVNVGKLTTEFITEKKFDKIICHFIDRKMMSVFDRTKNIPIIIWFHGVECLSWKKRLFEISKDRVGFLKYIIANEIQLFLLRKFLNKNEHRIQAVFVSKWMKDVAIEDIKYSFKNYHIIPNPIDTNLFEFEQKTSEKQKEVLVIRPFSSRKYATDLIVQAIQRLNEQGHTDINYKIYGNGPLWDEQTLNIRGYSNVVINKTFLNHDEIATKHKESGVFLCPTRQDAQGVSMCEAMASGLVVISSNCTAIPEFVMNEQTGMLAEPEDVDQLANLILKSCTDENLYQNISKNASQFINEKCGLDSIIKKEIKLITEKNI
ncbi:MAG: glycosyltransferase family 4 protein [Culicoidibacterales bacterium]